MRCHCCNAEVTSARQAKVRPWHEGARPPGWLHGRVRRFDPRGLTYRWAAVCLACYAVLDGAGCGEIGGRGFMLAEQSRGDRAPVVSEAEYREFQRNAAGMCGADVHERPHGEQP